MRLRPAGSLRSFERSPVDRYFLGRTFCFWQLGTRYNGLTVFGAPDGEDVRSMTRAFAVAGRAPVERHRSLVDIRRLTGIDANGFAILLGFMRDTREVWAERVEKQALLCDQGPFGAAVIGLYHHMDPRYPAAVFTSREAALEWLQPVPELAGELDALEAQLFGTTPFVAQVRGAIEASGPTASPEEIGAALALGARTLQRRLRDAGTTFRALRDAVRLERARTLLGSTHLPVADIARRVGFETPSSFIAWFRSIEGRSPSRWRDR